MKKIIWVLVNCNSVKKADYIGKALLKKRLASCYDIFLRLKAAYFWPPKSGRIETSKGAVLAVETLPKIGIQLADREEFACCPEPISFRGAADHTWLVLAARNLCLAEKRGANIISLCNGCENTLSQCFR